MLLIYSGGSSGTVKNYCFSIALSDVATDMHVCAFLLVYLVVKSLGHRLYVLGFGGHTRTVFQKVMPFNLLFYILNVRKF